MKSIKTSQCAGFSLIEVLITLIIVLIGLLGIAALQGKAQLAELESYQRAQALILMSDIVDRMNTHRATVGCFAITTDTTNGTPYLGTGNGTTYTCSASTGVYNDRAEAALSEVDNFLKGAAEVAGGASVGAMIGARSCISYDATTELGGVSGTGLYTIAISWQGMSAFSTPTVSCGNNLYGDEAKRRTISTTMRLASLWP